MRRILLVFLKFPEPGRVKTRIARETGPNRAVEIYREMTAAVLESVKGIKATEVQIVFDPPEKESDVRDWLAEMGAPEVSLAAQAGGDLGERLLQAIARAFDAGNEQVAVIGTDSPDIQPTHVEKAWSALNSGADVVFGPAFDGGFYLIALARSHPDLLKDIAWSQSGTLDQCITRATSLGLRVSTLPPLHDIDTLADWERWKGR